MCWARSWLAIGRKWIGKQAFVSLAREGYTLFIRGFLAILAFLGFLEFQGLLGFLGFLVKPKSFLISRRSHYFTFSSLEVKRLSQMPRWR